MAPGSISVQTRRLSLNNSSQIRADASPGSTGQGGDITLGASESITLGNAAWISDLNGAIAPIPSQPSTISIITPRLTMGQQSLILAETYGSHDASHVRIMPRADGHGDLIIIGDRSGAEITSSTSANPALFFPEYFGGREHLIGKGKAGNIDLLGDNITVSGMVLKGEAKPGVSGAGGAVRLTATGDIVLDNGTFVSSATYDAGDAGDVLLTSRNILVNGAEIGSRTYSPEIHVVFEAANLDHVFPERPATGAAGSIRLNAADEVRVINGAVIQSSSESRNALAGDVEITAARVIVDGPQTQVNAAVLPGFSGRNGAIDVTAHERLAVTNGATLSLENAGVANDPANVSATILRLSTPVLDLSGGGRLSTETLGNVTASRIVVQPVAGSDGRLEITSRSGEPGVISSSTRNAGGAGDILLTGTDLALSNVRVQSQAVAGSTGDAGTIDVSFTGRVSLADNTTLGTDTLGSGSAGNVSVRAGQVHVNSSLLSSMAHVGSSGQTGNLSINATQSIDLENHARLSISNAAHLNDPRQVTKSLLSVSAPTITLRDSLITAESSGNVAASDIDVRFTERLALDPSGITTNAAANDGGAIRIAGGKLMDLMDSWITTSVSGSAGNGGDIDIQADLLLLLTGFIQANTAGLRAQGGTIRLQVDFILPSGQRLVLGGNTPLTPQVGVFGFNVIQAAAPDGVSGEIRTSAPLVDMTGSLQSLRVDGPLPVALGRDLCRLGLASSFTPLGPGGLRMAATGLVRHERGLDLSAANHETMSSDEMLVPLMVSRAGKHEDSAVPRACF